MARTQRRIVDCPLQVATLFPFYTSFSRKVSQRMQLNPAELTTNDGIPTEVDLSD